MDLPDLRILPLDQLVPHEHTDPRRVDPLLARLRDEDVLKNPPIVAPFGNGDSRYVVLDGANRTTAFARLGMPHILAQVVSYDSVELHVWHHVITRHTFDDLVERIAAVPGIRVRATPLIGARAALARREALAFVSCVQDPKVFCVEGGADLISRTDLLNRVVHMYEGVATVQRTTSDTLADARAAYPDASAVVVFPRFQPAEIIDLAQTGVRVPAGITRHVLPVRALRVNYPMHLLREDAPVEHKNARLRDWVGERFRLRQARVYAEPTVLFDE
jgi:hypothetical protein